MFAECFERLFFGYLFLSRRDNRNDVAVRNGRMNQNTRRLNVRHNGHQVDRLVRRRFIDLQRVR